MKYTEEERDTHNKKIAREGSWLCEMFQENPMVVGVKKRILKELMTEDKKQKDLYAAQEGTP